MRAKPACSASTADSTISFSRSTCAPPPGPISGSVGSSARLSSPYDVTRPTSSAPPGLVADQAWLNHVRRRELVVTVEQRKPERCVADQARERRPRRRGQRRRRGAERDLGERRAHGGDPPLAI